MNFTFKLSQRLARMRLPVALAGSLALGCNITDAGPVVARIERIDVAPARLSLLPLQSAELTIDVTLSRGDSGAAAAALNWSTTGGLITSNFLVGRLRHITYQSPAQAGTYLLIVTAVTGAPADTASIAVATTPAPVNTVTIAPGALSVAVGAPSPLRATLLDATGAVVVGRLIAWSTSDAGVVTVLATGAIRAMGAGTATITATSEERSGTAIITVRPGTP